MDNGSRSALELCDLDVSQLKMGDRVEPTFRKLFTSDGIQGSGGRGGLGQATFLAARRRGQVTETGAHGHGSQ
jgi:hypothetical protein